MVFPRDSPPVHLQLWNAAAAGWEGLGRSPRLSGAQPADMIDSEAWPAREIVADLGDEGLWNAAAAGWEGLGRSPRLSGAQPADMIDSEAWPAREIVACHAGAE